MWTITQTYRTVSTVYIEYQSVVTHSHSLTHTSAVILIQFSNQHSFNGFHANF